MAKDVRFLISASADKAIAEMKAMQDRGEDVSKLMGYAFQRLGTTSDAVFQRQKDSARTAFELIRQSGVASAADIERAQSAMQSKLADIDKSSAMQNVGRGAKDAAGDVQGLTGHVNILSESILRLAGPAVLGMLAKSSIAAALATEKYTAAMEATAGSSAAAAREIQFIREESQRLGLNFVETAGAFAKFSASTKNTSIEGEATRKIFVGVSEAVTAMKLSGDEANGIFLALSQMMSKGKISAEELNGQLGERLPGALKLTADAMGMTTAELLKQMEQGKLMSADVLPKLAEQLHKTYGESATKSAQGGQAAINRFNNEVKSTAAAIGTTLMPALNTMAGAMANMMKTMREAPPGWLSSLGYAVSPVLMRAIRSGAKDAAVAPVSSKKTDAELAAETVKTDQAKTKEAAERAKAAGENQKKEFEKQKDAAFKAFQDKARGILDIEKDRVKSLLNIEKEYGARLADQYKERVSQLESFRQSMEAVSESKAQRDKKRAEEQAVALRGAEDDYQKYYRVRNELSQAESDLDNEAAWSPASLAKKAKAYDDLIKKSEEQMELARTGSIANVSAEEAIYNARATRESLERKIEELGKRQISQMEESAIAAAQESDAWQTRIKATEDRVRVLDQMLQNLPRVKEIDINLRVNGLANLQSIPGIMQNTGSTSAAKHYGDYYTQGGNTYWANGELAEAGTSVIDGRASGGPVKPYTTYRINENGAEFLTMGNKGGYITPAGKTPPGQNSASITIQGGLTFTLPNVTNQTTAAELARQVWPEIQKIAARQRAA